MGDSIRNSCDVFFFYKFGVHDKEVTHNACHMAIKSYTRQCHMATISDRAHLIKHTWLEQRQEFPLKALIVILHSTTNNISHGDDDEGL